MIYIAINICSLEWWHIGLALLLPFVLGYLLAYGIWSHYKRKKMDLESEVKQLKKKIADLEAELDACKHKRVDLESEIALLKGQLREKNLEISTLEASLAANKTANSGSDKEMSGASGTIVNTPLVGGSGQQAKDDLTKIEGIGPKIAGLLYEAGINTFSKLANTAVNVIRDILDAAGPQYRIADPGSWPEQAGLAATGKLDELKDLQDNLKGGKKS